MSLNLAASGDYLSFSANSLTKSGDSTFLVIMKRSADSGATSARALNWVTSADVSSISFHFISTTDLLRYSANGTVVASTMSGKVADGWMAIAVTKTTGTTAPRFHKFVYSTGIASHESAVGTIPDSVAVGAGARMLLGRITAATATTSFGDYAIAAAWDRVLSDSEFETITQSLSAIKASQPNGGLWVFDHAITSSSDEFFIGSTWQAGFAVAVVTPDGVKESVRVG